MICLQYIGNLTHNQIVRSNHKFSTKTTDNAAHDSTGCKTTHT